MLLYDLFSVTVGFTIQKGSRHTPRAEGYVLPPPPWSKEEPVLSPLHLLGRHHKRNSHRGQRQRAGTGHTGRKSYMG